MKTTPVYRVLKKWIYYSEKLHQTPPVRNPAEVKTAARQAKRAELAVPVTTERGGLPPARFELLG
jgi:hypothetical protein